MLKRNKKLASIILIAGLTFGVVGCSKDNKEKKEEVQSKVESTVSKNDEEESNNKEEKEEVSTKESQLENEEREKKEETSIKDTSKSEKKDTSNSNDTKKKSSSTSSNKKKTNTTSSNTTTNKKPSKPAESKPQQEKPSEQKPVEQNKPTEQPKPQPAPEQQKPVEQPKPQPVPEQPKPVERTWEYMSGLSSETFNALNSFRQANGVAPLAYSSSEQSRANKQAEYNAQTKTFNHDIDQISLGQVVGNAQTYINQWANSSGHKNNMLDSEYTQGAVSVYKDSNNEYYVVASFHLDW